MQPEHIVAGGILASFAVLYLYVAYYVASDARQRGSDIWFVHGAAALVFSLPYAGLYFVVSRSND